MTYLNELLLRIAMSYAVKVLRVSITGSQKDLNEVGVVGQSTKERERVTFDWLFIVLLSE